jgi:hypothetical protein
MLSSLGSLLMRVIFFCILTPIAVVLRLFGYDPLKVKSNQAMSQWAKRKPVKFDKTFFHKQG